MEMCYRKKFGAKVKWGFLEKRKFSKSEASVQSQGFWEGSRAREGLETRVQGSKLFEFPGLRISSVWKADVF